jgi:hypothetical protein
MQKQPYRFREDVLKRHKAVSSADSAQHTAPTCQWSLGEEQLFKGAEPAMVKVYVVIL